MATSPTFLYERTKGRGSIKMNSKISKELAYHRLEQAKEDLKASRALYELQLYKSANNRAYYSIFHSLKSILAMEPIDFKRHKDVISYFNKNYVNTQIFPKSVGRKISNASNIREDSDYDDEFVAKREDTYEQIKTAEEIIQLVEKYLSEK